MTYDNGMNHATVILYTSLTCPYCDEIRDYLRQTGHPFEERRVDLQPAAAQAVVAAVGDEVVPVVMIHRADASPAMVIGFDRQRLEALLGDAE
jgi:glutaredoxin